MIEYKTGKFKKDCALLQKRGYNLKSLNTVIKRLKTNKPLPYEFRDHPLKNSVDNEGLRVCHIKFDWVLIYKMLKETNELVLVRTGTHCDVGI